MNCYNHPDRPAVVQCKQCGKGFCSECANEVVDGLCSNCRQINTNAQQRQYNYSLSEEQKWHRKGLVFLVVGLVLVLFSTIFEKPKTDQFEFPNIFLVVGAVLTLSYFFRYARRIVLGLMGLLTPKGWGCLVNPLFLFFLEFLVICFIIIPVSPLLLIYSIARAFFLKKGIRDYLTWLA